MQEIIKYIYIFKLFFKEQKMLKSYCNGLYKLQAQFGYFAINSDCFLEIAYKRV